MKKLVRKSLILGLIIGSMALVGCGGGQNNPDGSSKPAGSSKSGIPQFEVKYVGADGAEISKTNVDRGSALTKPTDPAAPAGKRFYGWMNVKNGGQIWDYENEDINIVLKDVELQPCFVDATLQEQYLEGELCPDIVTFDYEKNDDGSYKTDDNGQKIPIPMDGATYSGGQKGKGLIYRAFDGDFAAHGAYIREDIDYTDETTGEIKTKKGVARYATEQDPADDVFAGFVHFMYINGDRLTWEIESDVAAENVTLFMRLSGEYGLPNDYNEKVSFTFTDEMFKVKVNDQPLQYGSVTIDNVEAKTFITFQDYLVSANVSLRQGKNTIQMLVDNNVSLDGTISSTAPCVDCIKLISSSNITWDDAQISNLSK